MRTAPLSCPISFHCRPPQNRAMLNVEDFMGAQTTTIEIDQMTAVLLRARAQEKGLTIDALLREMTEAESAQPSFETATPEERARAVEEWANRHRSSAPPLSDEAISRDNIYGERENKQL